MLYLFETKMAARCEAIGKFVLPVFRALVAKELVNIHHLTQVDAAKKLGTTQAAISQYVTSKRAIKGSEQFTAMLPKIQAMAIETARHLAKNEANWAEATSDFCKLCSTLCRKEDQTGDYYAI
jgi:predicted transcriptional regulator